MREIVLATRSAGKLRELVALVRAAGLEPRTLDELGVAETGDEDSIECFDTFEENATAKARWFSARCGGRPVLADDSGLCVDALGGAPGVRSKRWAGEPGLWGRALDDANNAKLLHALATVNHRAARYVCVVVLSGADGERTVRAECHGTIVPVARGRGGFGYDPYFLSDELGMTFGEADAVTKERVSHRGRAVRAMLAMLHSEKRLDR